MRPLSNDGHELRKYGCVMGGGCGQSGILTISVVVGHRKAAWSRGVFWERFGRARVGGTAVTRVRWRIALVQRLPALLDAGVEALVERVDAGQARPACEGAITYAADACHAHRVAGRLGEVESSTQCLTRTVRMTGLGAHPDRSARG